MNDKKNIRMCVCCRARFEKHVMLRVASVNQKAEVDLSSSLGGRGAYLCSVQCLENSVKGRRLERALKCHIDEETYAVIKTHLQLFEKRES